MEKQLTRLKESFESSIQEAKDIQALEQVKANVLGKNGELTSLLKQVSQLPPEQRPLFGKLVNQTKSEVMSLLMNKHSLLDRAALNQLLQSDSTDASLPSVALHEGHYHPIHQVMKDVIAIFDRCGFCIKQGPDIESDHFNFEALNIAKDHPARDMHDTFYTTDNRVLRTHTSPVQIRTMLEEKPPLRILAPGKVYRYDADTSHSPVFHQIEGLYVDKNVNFSQLKAILSYFLRTFFGQSNEVRFRSSYFPFTEPSVEVDVRWHAPGTPLHGKWFEVMGAGLVQREVFRQVDIDPDEFTGFAFGMGLERLAMLKYQINDIRLFYDNDQRFLNQF